MAATPSKIRAFYNSWYRPDLQAVIAVGDFDPAVIEAQIKKHFGGIPAASADAPKRVLYDVPGNKAPLIAIASDKEAINSSVDLIFKRPAKAMKTVADYREELLQRLYTHMLNSRFSEIVQKPEHPAAEDQRHRDPVRNLERPAVDEGGQDHSEADDEERAAIERLRR